MTQSERKSIPHPGAFRSRLIPYTDQILNWWYDGKLPAAEIQRRLAAQGLEANRTTVMRFIKVRERLAQTRKRPAALTGGVQHDNPTPAVSQSDAAQAEAMLKKLATSSPQQLWREADAAHKVQ